MRKKDDLGRVLEKGIIGAVLAGLAALIYYGFKKISQFRERTKNKTPVKGGKP